MTRGRRVPLQAPNEDSAVPLRYIGMTSPIQTISTHQNRQIQVSGWFGG